MRANFKTLAVKKSKTRRGENWDKMGEENPRKGGKVRGKNLQEIGQKENKGGEFKFGAMIVVHNYLYRCSME